MLWSFLIILLFNGFSLGQSIGSTSSFNFETGVSTLTACGGSSTFRVKLTAVVALSGNSIAVAMPAGVEYVPAAAGGGLSVVSGTGTVSEGDISNLAAPVFTVGDLSVGQVLEFTYTVKASCAIITYVEALNVPLNNYTFTSTSPSRTEAFQTVGFNVLYGVPSIIDVKTNGVSTAGYAGNIGDVIERTVLIKNGGNGVITSNTYLELDGSYAYSSIGGPYSTGATLTGSRLALSTAAFGGDGVWSPDETIEVTYHETITSCPVGTPSRNIYAGYGCNSSDCKITQTKATQVSTPFLPNLSFSMVNNGIVCPGEQSYSATITVVNRGQGTARNFVLEAYNGARSSGLYDPMLAIDTAGVTYTLNGGSAIHPYPSEVRNWNIPATNRLCSPGVASTVAADIFYNLGNLEPGDSIVFTVTGMSCLSSLCGPVKHTLFNAAGYWNEGCTSATPMSYEIPAPGGTVGGATVNIQDNGAVKIEGTNQPIEIGMNYVNYFRHYEPPSSGGYLDICMTIPAGLLFDETQPDSYIIANLNDPTQIWRPSSYTRNGNTVCYHFLHSTLPSGVFNGGQALQKFALSQDCASGSGVLPISFTYTVKNSDACTLEHQLNCFSRNVVSLCPAPCPTGGLITSATNAVRKNLGKPDNNNDGIPDGVGSLDLSKVSTTQYVLGDTMSYSYQGTIKEASDLVTYPLNTQFEYAYLNVGVPTMGSSARFELLNNAKVTVKKMSGGVVTCEVPATAGTSNFTIALNNCSALLGYVFQPGDSIWVEQLLKTNGINNMDSQDVVTTTAYASHSASPADNERYGCGVSFDRYRVSGFWYYSARPMAQVGCDGKLNSLSADFRYTINSGSTGGSYGYGNAFPFEYRMFGYPTRFKFVLPNGYAYDAAGTTSVQFISGPVPITPIFALNPPTISGDTLIFDATTIYKENGGSFEYPDEGFNGVIYVPITKNCDAPKGVSLVKHIIENNLYDPEVARLVAANFSLSGNEYSFSEGKKYVRYLEGNVNNINYKLNLSSISTISNSEDGTVSYRIRLSNDGTTAMDNTWLRSQNDAIVITRIVDETSNVIYTPNANGFFELGQYTPGYARNYTLLGVLAQCEDAQDFIYTGSCGAYPTSWASTCAKDTLLLEAHPGQTDFQTILRGPNGEVPLCDDADFSFEVKASKLGNVEDVLVNFHLPQGASIVPGSVYYNYPADAADVLAVDPSSLTGTAVFNVSGYNTQLGTVGLRGVGTSDPDSSEVKVKFKVRTGCNFTPGARFRAEYRANDACGNALDPRANTADLAIPGLGALPYRTTVLLITADTAHCAETSTKLLVNITNVVGGTATGSNDSVYVELPPNVSFSGYSYAANGGDYLNAPTATPSVYGISGGYTRVAWLLPSGIPSGGSINFLLTYSLDGAGICELDSIHAYTGVVNSSSCSTAPGGSCDVLFLNSTVPGKTVPYYQPEISLLYAMNSYCISDPNPTPTVTGCGSSVSGTFSASPSGLSLNTSTGEIDPVASVAGKYLITYTVAASGTSCLASSDTMTVTVKGESCPPLPVVLVDFQAKGEEDGVELTWRTTGEDNSDRFEVEHSTDGKYWTVIGRVAAKGTSHSEVRYNFHDGSPMSGQNVYRLKMVDRDGSYGYSRLASVRFDNGGSSLYPNPVSDKLTLGLRDFGKVTSVELHDSGGRKVYDSGPRPVQELSMKHLSNGVYVASIHYKGGMTRIFKVVVNH